MDIKDIGEAVKFYAKQKGTTVTEIARNTGLGKPTLYRLQTEPESVKLGSLFKILESLELEFQILPKYPAIEVKAV